VLDNGTKFQGKMHMDDSFTRNADVYEHGILTYGLGEYYTMTKDERVTELLKQAITYIVQGQGPGGGWMYNFDKTANDLSVSGWQIRL
jgi:rhamnogalacturonyl hydrolase YesR